jgi:hypothetical protein
VVEVAVGVLVQPLPLAVVDHLASAVDEHAAGAAVDRDDPRPPEVAAVAPPASVRRLVLFERERTQDRRRVVRTLHACEERVVAKLSRREIPEMLVDPVRRERARDPVLPPRLGAHPLDPLARDVPVVVDVVVVEDHRARDGREHPPDHRVAPRLPVEARVLLEVGDLLPRLLLRVPPGADVLQRLRRHLVRVHLVAEEKECVRPLLVRRVHHAERERMERVRAETRLVLVRRERVRRLVGRRDAARPEEDLEVVVARDGPDETGREPRRRIRPDALAVERDLVRCRGPRLETLDHDDRVVVTGDVERRRRMAENLDLAWRIRLDPHGRIGLADVTKEGSEKEARHVGAPAG